MSFLLAVAGFILVGLVLLDIVVTTLTMDGGGRTSNWLSYTTWKIFRAFKRVTGKSRMMMITGPVTLLIVFGFWGITTWAGWVLIFSWDAIPIIRDSSERLATVGELIYYTGYTITTIGYGDFRAEGTLGQISSVIAGVNGLSILTLGITYSMQVLTAVTEKRRLALTMDALQTTSIPDDSAEIEQLQEWANELGKLDIDIAGAAQKYLAYPVIHFFPDQSRRSSLPLKVADLWRGIESATAREDMLSVSTTAQFKKTKILMRALTINAIKCHWSFEHGNNLRGNNLQHEPLEELIRSYVDTAGWSWEEENNA